MPGERYRREVLRVPEHLGMLVADLDAGMEDLSALLGVEWGPVATGYFENRTGAGEVVRHTVSRVHTRSGPSRIELIWPAERDSPFATTQRFLLHHWAYSSTDVTAEVADLEEDGWTVELTSTADPVVARDYAFLHREGELRIELVETGLRARLPGGQLPA